MCLVSAVVVVVVVVAACSCPASCRSARLATTAEPQQRRVHGIYIVDSRRSRPFGVRRSHPFVCRILGCDALLRSGSAADRAMMCRRAPGCVVACRVLLWPLCVGAGWLDVWVLPVSDQNYKLRHGVLYETEHTKHQLRDGVVKRCSGDETCPYAAAPSSISHSTVLLSICGARL